MDNLNDLIFVSNNLELATLAFGWYMYGQLWNLMLDTGLAFLPFLGMIINNFVQPITATYTTSAAQLSLKKVEWDLIQMLMIIVLAGQPFLELKMDKYRRLDLCQRDGKDGFKSYEQAKIDSTSDGHKEKPISSKKLLPPKVPLWWYAVQSFSTGFTEAAKAAVPCAQDARGMLSDMISGTMVDNTSLAREVEDFIEKCYIPTKSFIKLDTESGSKSDSVFDRSKYAEYKKVYASAAYHSRAWFTETEYIGSRVSNAMGAREESASKEIGACIVKGCDNFYGRTVKIRGWGKSAPSEVVKVSCREWWGGQTTGPNTVGAQIYNLGKFVEEEARPWVKNPTDKDKPPTISVAFETLRQLRYRLFLVSTIDSEILSLQTKGSGSHGVVSSSYSLTEITQGGHTDFQFVVSPYAKISTWNTIFETVKNYPQEAREGVIDNDIYRYVMKNIIENLENLPQTKEPGFWKRGAAGIGLLMASLGTYATAYIARESFPHIQALLLMAMCMFMGMGLVFSGYTLQFLYAGSLGIFTLKFMGFILYFCHWIDNNLIVFLSGQKGMSGEGAWTNLSEVVDAVYTDRGFSRLILDYSIAGIYFSFPSLFATVMVWAGIRGAEVIGEAQKAANPLEQAAQHGAQQVQKIVTQLASVGGEKIPGVGHAIRFMKGKH